MTALAINHLTLSSLTKSHSSFVFRLNLQRDICSRKFFAPNSKIFPKILLLLNPSKG